MKSMRFLNQDCDSGVNLVKFIESFILPWPINVINKVISDKMNSKQQAIITSIMRSDYTQKKTDWRFLPNDNRNHSNKKAGISSGFYGLMVHLRLIFKINPFY